MCNPIKRSDVGYHNKFETACLGMFGVNSIEDPVEGESVKWAAVAETSSPNVPDKTRIWIY